MAVEKAALRVTELDFLSIRDNLKTFLQSQNEFQDFDFEGPGMAVLLDILAYNTHYMGYYLNMVGNEMFLDTAQIRASVLSHAKNICYVPGSKKGALAKVNITITPSVGEDQVASSVTLDKYTKLLGRNKDGVNYPFVTVYSNTATKNGSTFSFSNVYVRQGEVVTLQYLMDSGNESRRFEIPSANVDLDSMVVTVQQSSSNTDTFVYSLAEDITELTANSKVYFVEENENLNYTIYFGDDVLGKKPIPGNIIICTYLDTVGEVSNSVNNFTFVEPIGGEYSDNVIVSSVLSSYGGVEKETVDQVRFRAPYFYTSQNRAVTINDYKTLLVKNYNYIDSVAVWGGEDNDPVIYGKVFISIKTRGNYALTNLEKEQLKDELIQTLNVLTVTPEIINPDYAYLVVTGSVYYNASLTSLTAAELQDLVIAAIQDYSTEELTRFDSVFRKSKLQTYIENAEKSITSSDINVFVQKRVLIDILNTKTYTISYNMPLQKGSFSKKLSTFPELEINDAYGIARNTFIEEVPESATGIYSIDLSDFGSGYTSAPTVTITGDGTGAIATAVVVGGRVTSISVDTVGQNYTGAIVSITGGGGSGASATAKLQSEVGTLRTVYYKTNGEKVILNSNTGTIDYTLGKITLNSLRVFEVIENEFYDDGYLAITIPTQNDTIQPLRNRILSIDEADPKSIQISMISE